MGKGVRIKTTMFIRTHLGLVKRDLEGTVEFVCEQGIFATLAGFKSPLKLKPDEYEEILAEDKN
jgi:hypothetical protein